MAPVSAAALRRQRRALHRDLRLAVFALRSGERRRRFPPALHVGRPGAPAATYVEDAGEPLDAGLRAEIAAALLSRALLEEDAPAAWLTRVGSPDPHDLDAGWLAPVRRAFDEAEVLPRCVAVVTKQGWYDPWRDERVVWDRLRMRAR